MVATADVPDMLNELPQSGGGRSHFTISFRCQFVSVWSDCFRVSSICADTLSLQEGTDRMGDTEKPVWQVLHLLFAHDFGAPGTNDSQLHG
jgi:hypothetical protein